LPVQVYEHLIFDFIGTHHGMTCGYICPNLGVYPGSISHGIDLFRYSVCEFKHRIFILKDQAFPDSKLVDSLTSRCESHPNKPCKDAI